MSGKVNMAVAAALVLAAADLAGAAVVGRSVLDALREGPRVRVIVSLREPAAPATDLTLRNAEVDAVQGNVLEGLPARDFVLTHRWQSLSAFAGEVSLAGLYALATDPDVLMVDVDVAAYAAAAESAQLIRADQVRGAGVTGMGVVVAVLDTGADTRHPDIRGSLVGEACFCTSPGGAGCCPNGSATQSGEGAASDDQGHGTNVTGIITSDGMVAPLGIAPDAQIVAVKVLDSTGAGTAASILSGLDHVINARPEVKLVNISIGLANLFPGTCDGAASFTSAFASAINTLRGRGTLVFASTGNNASSSQIAVPACIGGAIAVGAVYKGDAGTISFGCTDATTRADRVACFSNSDAAVDVLAPGAPVTSAGRGGGLSTFIGTSQACPVALATAALLLQANPSLSAAALEAALKDTGVTVTDPKNGLSFRRIDAKAALDSIR
ncbi:MAG TPA: S8 family serine peptidase [Vicinamibacteria bacterium]|nr:S8 family serine peptidase [Vicinamibacteria bacterium]